MHTDITPAWVCGEARLFQVGGPKPDFQSNLVLYDWGTIFAQLLRNNPDGKSRHISAMYFEFENNAGAAVTVPTPTRSGNKSYYDTLGGDPKRDYLRVPIIGTQLGSSNPTLFPAGNQPTFLAQTQGAVGVHGKTFSAAQQSRVYGAALVATPTFNDDSQDLILSRFYYTDAASQLIKATSSQIGIEWRLTFN